MGFRLQLNFFNKKLLFWKKIKFIYFFVKIEKKEGSNRNSSQMSTKSANSSTTNSTDDLTMDSNYNIDTDSTGAERILKLLPATKFTGYYKNNGLYTVFSPGSYTDTICRKESNFLTVATEPHPTY